MKRYASVTIRSLFALAGILYIVLTLTWTDQLLAPAGMRLPDGRVLEEPARLKLLHRPTPPATDSLWVVEIDDGQTLNIDPKLVTETDQPGKYHFLPGIFTTLGGADVKLVALGFLAVGLIYPLQMVRWWLLMVCRGMNVTLLKALKLNLVGAFFNFCMPGTTGGDVVKAYYAAKGSNRAADAVMSVVFDRIAGLIGLILLTGFAGAAMVAGARRGWLGLTFEEAALVKQVTIYIWAGIGLLVLGAVVYFSRWLRQLFRVDAVLKKLPGGGLVAKVDAAAVAYRDHPWAMVAAAALSVPVHLSLVGGAACAGYALGLSAPLGLLLAVLPVIFMAGSVPITPLGLGVMEGLGHTLLVDPPAVTYNHIVGMLLIWRLYQIAYASTGSILLLKGDIRLHPAQGVEVQSLEPGVQGPKSESRPASG